MYIMTNRHGAILVSCLLFAVTSPTFADCASVGEKCSIERLGRDDDYNFRLAVCQEGEWHVCKSNSTTSPHNLTARSDQVAFYWAVPASDDYQIVYASTSFTDEQRLSVSRNATPENKRLWSVIRLLPPFRDVRRDLQGDEARQRFKAHHRRDGRRDDRDEISAVLNEWHQTEAIGYLKSYDLVGSSLDQKESNRPLLAAERLIRVMGKRPRTSWIRFTSDVEQNGELHMVLAYSGSNPTRTWPFHFDVDPVVTEEASNDH